MKESFLKFKNDIRGKKIAVLGIGISNSPLIKYIVSLGAKVTACDKKMREDIGENLCSEFESMGVELRLGADYLKNLDGFDMIFKTPSLRPDMPELIYASERGSVITSEMEEFVKHCPAEIIGITGSDGKTTTTTLVYNMLKEEGYKVWLGGNIGNPLFDKLDHISKEDKVVLELSSFQLMTMKVSPNISVITNLSPNHLDIHKSMEEYIEAKENIFKFQDNSDLLVLNLDNEITRGMQHKAKGEVDFFTRKSGVEEGTYLKDNNLILKKDGKENIICNMDEVKLPGLHNIENILAASAAVKRLCSIESIRKVAVTFKGVEHRIEFVREIDGVKFYNGSIASSPTRTIADLNAFRQKVILIAGGYDKKIPFDDLAKVGVHKVKVLVLLGATANKIEEAFRKQMEKTGIKLPIFHANSLEDAVNISKDNAAFGDIITLSPACASFDMFKNFEERGKRFKEIVNSL